MVPTLGKHTVTKLGMGKAIVNIYKMLGRLLNHVAVRETVLVPHFGLVWRQISNVQFSLALSRHLITESENR